MKKDAKGAATNTVERYELTRSIDPDHFFPTLDAAIDAFVAFTGATWQRPTKP